MVAPLLVLAADIDVRTDDPCDRSMALSTLSACPPFDFGIEYSAVAECNFYGNPAVGKLTDRLPGINVKKQILLGGIMHYSNLTSFADPQQADPGRPFRGHKHAIDASGVKCVAPLENDGESVIFFRQQGAKRHRDKNVVPTPRQVVTHCIGSLPIVDIALQHSVGNRWLWHRQKSKGSATVCTEVSEATRPA
jgi:hypothetical protein